MLFYYVTTNDDDDGENLPNHPVGTLPDVRQVRVAGAHVEKLALDGFTPGLVPRRGSHIPGRSGGGGGAAGADGRCVAARIRHSFLSEPLLLLCQCAALSTRSAPSAVVSTLRRWPLEKVVQRNVQSEAACVTGGVNSRSLSPSAVRHRRLVHGFGSQARIWS